MKIMCVCRVELVSSKMVEKIFPKRRKAVVQATGYEKLWAKAALLIMIKLMISFMMLTEKIARLITVVLTMSTRKEDCIARGGLYSCTSLTVTIPNTAFWKIWMVHQTIDFHKSKPKYHLLEIQISDPYQTSSVSHKLWFKHCSSKNRHPLKICFQIRFWTNSTPLLGIPLNDYV